MRLCPLQNTGVLLWVKCSDIIKQCPRVRVCASLTQEVRVTSHLDSIHVLPVHLQHHHHPQQHPQQHPHHQPHHHHHFDVNHMTNGCNNMWFVVTGVKRRNVFLENCCLNWGPLQIARGRIVPGLHRRFSPFWPTAAVAVAMGKLVVMVIHAYSLTNWHLSQAAWSSWSTMCTQESLLFWCSHWMQLQGYFHSTTVL